MPFTGTPKMSTFGPLLAPLGVLSVLVACAYPLMPLYRGNGDTYRPYSICVTSGYRHTSQNMSFRDMI